MNAIYLVIGVDQDGDALWDVGPSLVWANRCADEKAELCHDERPNVYRISLPDFTVTIL